MPLEKFLNTFPLGKPNWWLPRCCTGRPLSISLSPSWQNASMGIAGKLKNSTAVFSNGIFHQIFATKMLGACLLILLIFLNIFFKGYNFHFLISHQLIINILSFKNGFCFLQISTTWKWAFSTIFGSFYYVSTNRNRVKLKTLSDLNWQC